MTIANSIAYRHYLRAISRWPKDYLRPECQFQDAIKRRVDRRFLPQVSVPVPVSVSSSGNKSITTTPPPQPQPPAAVKAPIDEEWELAQANVLYSLLENRYSEHYAITGPLMRPASNPRHYVDLARELELAPRRSWWEQTRNKWKGFLRFT